MECSESKHLTVTIDILEKHEPNPIHQTQQIKNMFSQFLGYWKSNGKFQIGRCWFLCSIRKRNFIKNFK